MSSLPVFVGLDYHQDSVQVCVMDQAGQMLTNRSLANDARGIDQVVRVYGTPQGAAIEACCGAADLGEELLDRHGWPVQLAHPGYVARIKQSPDKTDFGDARLLADLVRVGYLPKVWLAPEEIRRLRRLVRHRQQLVARRRDVKLRMRALLRENRQRPPASINAWTKAWFAWLERDAELAEDDRWIMGEHLSDLTQLTLQIRAVERRLAERAENDVVMQRLMQMADVGLITAATLRAEIGRFDRFGSGKQLARFCGASPRNASSGQRQADAGLIKAGNPQLRMVLIELAHRLIRRLKGRWSKLAYKLLRQGKPRNVVVAAVANRWVRWLYHQMQPAALAA
ncbi:MAG: IS110 family transposase [Methyloceanibacter sp.]